MIFSHHCCHCHVLSHDARIILILYRLPQMVPIHPYLMNIKDKKNIKANPRLV